MAGGLTYTSGNALDLGRAIAAFVASEPQFRTRAAAHAASVQSMDDHFERLFGSYRDLVMAARYPRQSTGRFVAAS